MFELINFYTPARVSNSGNKRLAPRTQTQIILSNSFWCKTINQFKVLG